MEFFRDQLRKLEQEEVLLYQEIQQEISLFREFFELFNEKKKAIEGILEFIEKKKGKQLMKSIGLLRRIPEINSRAGLLINRILALDEKEEIIIKIMLSIEGQSFEELKRHTKSLKKYFQHLDDKLRYLLGLLRSQTEYFNGKLEEELSLKVISEELIIGYTHFYHLLSIERNVVNEIAELFHQIRSEIRVVLNIEREEEQKNLSRVVVEDLINPESIAFREFYRSIYVKTYKNPDLRDTLSHMRGFLNRRFQSWHMSQKKLIGRDYFGQGRNHLLIAKIGPDVTAGILSEFIGLPQSKLSFGVIWYLCISPICPKDRLMEIFRSLHQTTINLLIRDSVVFGYRKFSGLLFEIRDPGKMKGMGLNKEQAQRIMNILMKRYGYKKLNLNYIQLPPGVGQKPVRDLSLMILPLNRTWIDLKGIPQHQCLKIIDIYSYCLVEEYEHNEHQAYLEMVEDIKRNKIVPFY